MRTLSIATAAVVCLATLAKAAEPAPRTVRDFVPRGTLFCAETADPVRTVRSGMARAGAAAGAPEMVEQWVVLALQRLAGNEGAPVPLPEALQALGWDPTRPALIGVMPFVDGRRTDLDLAGMLYAVIPVAEPARAELIVRRRLLPLFYRLSHRRCQRMRTRLRFLLDRQTRKQPEKDRADLLREPPADALACPCGADYRIGKHPTPACAIHEGAPREGDFEEALRIGLDRIEIGSMVYHGSVELGAAYGVNDKIIVVAPDARVVKACLQTAAGQHPRAAFAFPDDGLVRGAFCWTPLAQLLDHEHRCSWRGLRYGRTNALLRLLDLLSGLPPLALALEEMAPADGHPLRPLVLTGRMELGSSDWAKRLSRAAPQAPSLSRFLPPDTPVLLTGNVLPEASELLCMLIAAFGDNEAALLEFAPLLAGRQAAWAMTHARDGGIAGMPHMTFLLSRDDAHVARALDLLPGIVGGVARLQRLPDTRTAADAAYGVWVQPAEKNQTARELLFHADRPAFAALATHEADLVSTLKAAQPQAEPAARADRLPGLPGFAALGGDPRNANLWAYLDTPALVRAVHEARTAQRAEREQRWCFHQQKGIAQALAAYRQETGQAAPTLEALQTWAEGKEDDKEEAAPTRNWQPVLRNLHCPAHRQLAYTYADGRLSCPVHGRPGAPNPAPPEPRPLGREETILMGLLGRLRLEAWVDDEALHLRVAQQTLAQQAHPAGPAPTPEEKQKARQQEQPAEQIF